MARKKKHPEHVNHERWLVSYADFITLLFAFFVVMYAISSVNEGKYRVLSDSLVAAFRAPPKSIEPVQIGDPGKAPSMQNSEEMNKPFLILPNPPLPRGLAIVPNQRATRQQQYKHMEQTPQQHVEIPPDKDTPPGHPGDPQQTLRYIAAEIERAMAPLIEQNLASVGRGDQRVEVEIKSSILFASGSARLEQQALPILEKIAEILAPFPNLLNVEGFTDNVPIRTLAFPSNWELSAARAASVVHLFAQAGVAPERMAAVGYGEHRPVADNASEEGRSKNRRVVLTILGGAESMRPVKDALEAAQLPVDVAAHGLPPEPPPPPSVTAPDDTMPVIDTTSASPRIEPPVVAAPPPVAVAPAFVDTAQPPVTLFQELQQVFNAITQRGTPQNGDAVPGGTSGSFTNPSQGILPWPVATQPPQSKPAAIVGPAVQPEPPVTAAAPGTESSVTALTAAPPPSAAPPNRAPDMVAIPAPITLPSAIQPIAPVINLPPVNPGTARDVHQNSQGGK